MAISDLQKQEAQLTLSVSDLECKLTEVRNEYNHLSDRCEELRSQANVEYYVSLVDSLKVEIASCEKLLQATKDSIELERQKISEFRASESQRIIDEQKARNEAYDAKESKLSTLAADTTLLIQQSQDAIERIEEEKVKNQSILDAISEKEKAIQSKEDDLINRENALKLEQDKADEVRAELKKSTELIQSESKKLTDAKELHAKNVSEANSKIDWILAREKELLALKEEIQAIKYENQRKEKDLIEREAVIIGIESKLANRVNELDKKEESLALREAGWQEDKRQMEEEIWRIKTKFIR